MDNQGYEKVLQWGQSKGLKINSNVERKSVDGIYGMYATTDIPKHTQLLCFPLSGTLPISTTFKYPDNANHIIKYAHTAATEFEKGEESEWSGLLFALEQYDELKSHSAFFFSAEELDFIQSMNPILHRIILEKNDIIKNQIRMLCEMDNQISEQTATTIALNLKSRSWGQGFLPVFDLFNHSDKHGAQVFATEKNLYFLTARDYKAGEEIWISYGRRDMYDFAIDFDFFDPNSVHSIIFGHRGSQIIQSEFEKAIVQHASKLHKMSIRQIPQGLSYQLDENDAMILEHAPSARLIEYIQNTAFFTKEEYQQKKANRISFDLRYNQILDALLSANNVDSIAPNEVPDKLTRFYHLLQKEKQMLLNNKEWARYNSIFSNDIPPEIKRQYPV